VVFTGFHGAYPSFKKGGRGDYVHEATSYAHAYLAITFQLQFKHYCIIASFFAELLVEGYRCPLTNCTFGIQQQTHQRGRVSAKVRYEPVHVTADVPEDDFLLAWAADPHKHLAVSITFKNAVGGAALEAISMISAYCVRYDEIFQHGNTTNEAYQVVVTLSDPSGFTIQAGSPAVAFVTPAPGTHASTPAVATLAELAWLFRPWASSWP
jgi:hypothetical protein